MPFLHPFLSCFFEFDVLPVSLKSAFSPFQRVVDASSLLFRNRAMHDINIEVARSSNEFDLDLLSASLMPFLERWKTKDVILTANGTFERLDLDQQIEPHKIDRKDVHTPVSEAGAFLCWMGSLFPWMLSY